MAEQQPMNLQGLCYTAAEDRQALNDLVCVEGVSDRFGGDLLVTSTLAADHSVSVAAGSAYIQGDNDPPDQGMYRVRSDAAGVVQLPVGSGGGLNRIDTIVARVRDSEYSGLDNDWVLEVVAGTPGAGAGATGTAFTSTVIATAGAVPNNALVLGYVRVLAADTLTTIIAANNVHDARVSYQPCSSMASGTLVKAYRSSAYTIQTGLTVLPFNTIVLAQKPSLYDTTTGAYTAPVNGYYRISGNIGQANAGSIVIRVRVAGTNKSSVVFTQAASGVTPYIATLYAVAGQAIDVTVSTGGGAINATIDNEVDTNVTFERIG